MDLLAPLNELVPCVGLGEVDAVLVGQFLVHDQSGTGDTGGQAELLAVKAAVDALADVAFLKVGEVKVVVHVVEEVVAGGNKGGHRLGVDLDDVGSGAGGQLGGQLVVVAVRGAVLGLNVDVRVGSLKLLDDLEGGVGALIAAPPCKAQGDVTLGSGSSAGRGSGAFRCGSSGAGGAAAGGERHGHACSHDAGHQLLFLHSVFLLDFDPCVGALR